VSSESRERLRATFEEAPELYDRARPGYPAALFDDLTTLARLPGEARILEIGCGTGQATIALAERGYRVTCVELGEQLAAVARRKLSVFPAVEIVNADFETWRPRHAEFDAVVAFTAFHWIDPDLRYEKSASLLREGGALAVVAMQHVLPPDGDRFFAEVQEDYEAVLPDGFFSDTTVRRYVWDVSYTSDEYIAVLNTYSAHRALDDATRERLHDRIRPRIEARVEKSVRKTYLATLNVATADGRAT
jgi:SAM-dependent methyltransferase